MKGALLLAFESEYGVTPISPQAIKLPFNKNTLTSKQNTIESNTITGRRDPIAPGLGQIDVSGNVEFPLDARNTGHWLTLCFGAPVTTNQNTAGTLQGANGVSAVIATWIAITAGAFKISMDGSSKTTIGPIDFSTGIITMNDVAGKIQTAIRAAAATIGFTGATVTWDAINGKFTITSGSTGVSSSVSLLEAPATGSDISSIMKCNTGTATAGAALFKHVFKVQDDMPSASIEKGFSDLSKYAVYPGCKISKLSISAQVGNNELTATADIMGADEILNDASLDSSPTQEQPLRFNNFNATVVENGEVLGSARKMSLDIDFGLDGDTYCLNGNGTRTDIAEGIIKPTGTVESLFKDTLLLEKAINGIETSLKLMFTTGIYSLEILLPELIFERATPTIDGPKGVLLSMNYKSYYSNSVENSVIQITLTNDVASYAIA